MIERNQLNKIIEVIRAYSCDKPLNYFLKFYFLQHRNMGSRDRKIMRTFVYNYFRLGNTLKDLSVEERISFASFLMLNENNSLADYCITNYSSLNLKAISNSLDEKIKSVSELYEHFSPKNIFPFNEYLSPEVDDEDFCKSFLIQPDVFVRTKEKFKEKILAELGEKKIEYEKEPEMENTLRFNNAAQLTTLKSFTAGCFEIQDVSSQKTGDFFKPNKNEHWWDCCAGSGGKSLLLSEQTENLKITASDTRDSILKNLKERFRKAGLKNYTIEQTDLLTLNLKPQTLNLFDGIIADVPCSCSGTWARSPEMLTCFKESEIEKISSLQKTILQNITPHLKKGKPLIYITCSVFKKENEEVVDFAVKHLDYSIEKKELIKGYTCKADSMFVSRLIKN